MKALRTICWLIVATVFTGSVWCLAGADVYKIPHLPPRVMPVPRNNIAFNLKYAQLGYDLFHALIVSVNGTKSCGSCHVAAFAFSDPDQFSTGRTSVDPKLNPKGNRTSIRLDNKVYHPGDFWDHLEEGTNAEGNAWDAPQNPIEMGPQKPEDVAARMISFKADNGKHVWVEKFVAAGFNITEDARDAANIARFMEAFAICIAHYERTLVCSDTNFEQYQNGNTHYMTASEKHGAELFYSRRFACGICHADRDGTDDKCHNIGIEYFSKGGNLGNNPDIGQGAAVIGGRAANPNDNFKFATPRLIDCVSSKHFMHNGIMPDPITCIDYILAGGFFHRSTGKMVTFDEVQAAFASGKYIQPQDWIRDPQIDPLIQPVDCTRKERADLIAFVTISWTPRDRPTGERPVAK